MARTMCANDMIWWKEAYPPGCKKQKIGHNALPEMPSSSRIAATIVGGHHDWKAPLAQSNDQCMTPWCHESEAACMPCSAARPRGRSNFSGLRIGVLWGSQALVESMGLWDPGASTLRGGDLPCSAESPKASGAGAGAIDCGACRSASAVTARSSLRRSRKRSIACCP